MLCEKCNEREAKVHLTVIIHDEMTKRHLCDVCGKEDVNFDRWTVQTVPWKKFGTRLAANWESVLPEILETDSRYAPGAYVFVRFGMLKACARYLEAHAEKPGHISGAELLDTLREFASRKFGKEAKAKLNSWGVFKCEDFGEIVFNLIGAGLLAKQDSDSKDDFKGGYDFDAAFPS